MSTQDVTFNDLNWKIEYDPEKCTMCGSCVAACTFDAIEVTVERRDRTVSREGCPHSCTGARGQSRHPPEERHRQFLLRLRHVRENLPQ